MKKDGKQRLFEMMGKVDKSFKKKLNENFGDEEFDANQEPSYGFNPEEHPPISDEPETDQNNIVDTVKNGDFMIRVIEHEGMYGGEVYWKNKFVKYLPHLPNNTRESIIKRFKKYSDNVRITNHPRYDNKVFYNDDQSERIIDIDKNTLSEDSPFPVQGNNKYIDNHERYGGRLAATEIDLIIDYLEFRIQSGGYEEGDYELKKYSELINQLEMVSNELI